MSYKVKYRRRLLWKTIKVDGHQYHQPGNRMDFFLPDGSILSIGQWDKYDIKLGTDWVAFTKKQMEKQSGQQITIDKE